MIVSSPAEPVPEMGSVCGAKHLPQATHRFVHHRDEVRIEMADQRT
jgi:hypothetical protein